MTAIPSGIFFEGRNDMKKSRIQRVLLWLASLLVFCMICSPLAKEPGQKKEDETTEGDCEDSAQALERHLLRTEE